MHGTGHSRWPAPAFGSGKGQAIAQHSCGRLVSSPAPPPDTQQLGAHLKIVPECSSTILLCPSRAIQYHDSHSPAAAECLPARPGRCGGGAGHDRQATRVTTGFIRRVPARVPACGCFQGQAAPLNRARSSGAPSNSDNLDWPPPCCYSSTAHPPDLWPPTVAGPAAVHAWPPPAKPTLCDAPPCRQGEGTMRAGSTGNR